jgi:phage terminase large subunit-like protein
VWLDPAVTASDHSDAQGIQCDGVGADGLIYRLWSWEGRTTPLDALVRATRKAIEWGADTVGVETDQGGDTWRVVYHQACEELRRAGTLTGRQPRYAQQKAGAGHGSKATRAQRMLVDYERHRIRHLVGTHQTLEAGLMRFPKVKPFDLVDAAYWSWADLAKRSGRSGGVRSAVGVAMPEFRLN